MSALPEFVKRSSVEVKGTVEHSHHVDDLPRAELEKLIDLGKQAIELERAEDGGYE